MGAGLALSLVALLAACGAPPVVQAPVAGRIEALALTLGPPRALCTAERTVWIGHARGVVRWAIPRVAAPATGRKRGAKGPTPAAPLAGLPPGAEASAGVPGAPIWLGAWRLPAAGPGLVSLRCDAERVAVERADGQRFEASAQGLVPAPAAGGLGDGLIEGVGRDQPQALDRVPGTDSGAAAAGSPPAAAGPIPAAAGEVAWAAAWGFGVQRQGRWVFWRKAPGAVGDAAFDGQHLWLAATSGLWRHTPGDGRDPHPIALPPHLADTPLVRAFIDGPFLWVGTAEGHGHPVRVRAEAAREMPNAGRLNPDDLGLLAPVGGHLVRGQRGAAGLTIDGAPFAAVGEAPLRAFLPDRGHLWVATAQEVLWLQVAGGARVLDRWAQPGVVRLFALKDAVLAVTESDGVFRLASVP